MLCVSELLVGMCMRGMCCCEQGFKLRLRSPVRLWVLRLRLEIIFYPHKQTKTIIILIPYISLFIVLYKFKFMFIYCIIY
jgi:hypothetical protein